MHNSTSGQSLLLPVAIPFLMGRPDLVLPMLIGVGLAMQTQRLDAARRNVPPWIVQGGIETRAGESGLDLIPG
jgi:hypothetical protein